MTATSSKWIGVLSKGGSAVAALAGLALFLAWMGGAFHSKVPPGEVALERPSAAGRTLVAVTPEVAVETIDVVATVQPRRQADIASQILATVREVYVDPGAQVKIGDDLILLDDSELLAQQREAQASLSAAEADLIVRKSEVARLKTLLPKGNVAREEFDRVQAAANVAEALVNRSRQQVNRIEVQLGYTKIKATSPGIVADRYVEKGDLAVPGKPLLKLQDTREFELHASVPESQALRLGLNQKLPFNIDSARISNKHGAIREIVPLAQQATRSVLVKVTIPPDVSAPVFAGMFGRVSIPVGESTRLLIPASAVQQLGQLEVVDVEQDGKLDRRFIRTGRSYPNGIEVLSGLSAGERVALPAR